MDCSFLGSILGSTILGNYHILTGPRRGRESTGEEFKPTYLTCHVPFSICIWSVKMRTSTQI